MLVLNRKMGERILIGDDIVITIIERQGNSVRVGIDAPNNVSIDREEVRERKSSDNPMGNKKPVIKPGRKTLSIRGRQFGGKHHESQ